MKITKIIAGVMGALLFLLTAAACLSVTLADGGLLPGFLPIRGYAMQADALDGLLPKGSLVIVAPEAALEPGHVVLSPEGSPAVVDGEGWLRDPADPALAWEAGDSMGRMIYRIAGLGMLLQLISDGRMFVWAGLAMIAAGVALWMAGAPKRRRKKEVRELIELFEYYGRKYDAEEEGIDY